MITTTVITAVACAAQIQYIHGLPEDVGGSYRNGVIYMNADSTYGNEDYVLMHECGHYIQDTEDVRIPSYFGKPPYITPYSATSKYEDFAEVYAYSQMKRVEMRRFTRLNPLFKLKSRFIAQFR